MPVKGFIKTVSTYSDFEMHTVLCACLYSVSAVCDNFEIKLYNKWERHKTFRCKVT
jgi:hypothetical protein